MCNVDERNDLQESPTAIIEATRRRSYDRVARPDWVDDIRDAARAKGGECDGADGPTVAMRLLIWSVCGFISIFFWAMMYVLLKDIP